MSDNTNLLSHNVFISRRKENEECKHISNLPDITVNSLIMVWLAANCNESTVSFMVPLVCDDVLLLCDTLRAEWKVDQNLLAASSKLSEVTKSGCTLKQIQKKTYTYYYIWTEYIVQYFKVNYNVDDVCLWCMAII